MVLDIGLIAKSVTRCTILAILLHLNLLPHLRNRDSYLTKLWEMRKCALYIHLIFSLSVWKPFPLVHVFPLGLILALGSDMLPPPPPPPPHHHHHHHRNLVHSFSFTSTWYIYRVFNLATNKYLPMWPIILAKKILIWYGYPVPTN